MVVTNGVGVTRVVVGPAGETVGNGSESGLQPVRHRTRTATTAEALRRRVVDVGGVLEGRRGVPTPDLLLCRIHRGAHLFGTAADTLSVDRLNPPPAAWRRLRGTLENGQHCGRFDQRSRQHPFVKVVLTTEVGRVFMVTGKGGGQAGRRPHSIVEALNRDWDELVHRHRGSLPGWSRRHEALVGYESLDDLLVAAQGHPDAILGALLTEVSSGDQLAGRVVLQALLGRMVRMARRDPSAGVDDYVAALWCRIRTYPLATRPVRIAANLSMDTLKSVHAESRWLREGEVTPWPPEAFLAECHGCGGEVTIRRVQGPELSAVSVLRAGRDRALIDDSTHELMVSVYVHEISGPEAAKRHRTSPASVRVRCSRAVRRLAAHASELLVEAA
jgi:DNA-directed RNA polymerase specialized sigma24 family protein